MKHQYILHGWKLSYFTAKVRAYMRYKQFDFEDREMGAYDLMVRVPKKTGASVMPVVQTKSGQWLQDTTEIIALLDSHHPSPPISTATPVQEIASMLLEIWADEFWIPSAMHYRWSYPENYGLFEHDAGKALAPYAPRILKRKLVAYVAGKLKGYLPGVGVTPSQTDLIEQWTNQNLDQLEAHFEQLPYLLGSQPTIADFALVGPLQAHLNRDPASKRMLMDSRPNIQAWATRVCEGERAASPLSSEQAPAETLAPLLQGLFNELIPQCLAIAEKANAFVSEHQKQSGDGLPRSIGEITFPTLDGEFTRLGNPYTLWMLQRVKQRYKSFTDSEQQQVDRWLEGYQQPPLTSWNLGPQLKRKALRTRLA
jgi:glutathione S-transferase